MYEDYYPKTVPSQSNLGQYLGPVKEKKLQFQDIASSQNQFKKPSETDGFILKNQRINQLMQQKGASINGINSTSKMNTNLGSNDAENHGSNADIQSTIRSAMLPNSNGAGGFRSMANLNGQQAVKFLSEHNSALNNYVIHDQKIKMFQLQENKGGFNMHQQFMNSVPTVNSQLNDQNLIKKELKPDDDDFMVNDDFSSEDKNHQGILRNSSKKTLKKNKKYNSGMLLDLPRANKFQDSLKSVLSQRSKNSDSQTRKKRNTTNNSANQLNRAASQNLYYKREHDPNKKKKQAISFQNIMVAQQSPKESNSGSIEIPPCRKPNMNNKLELDLLNSMRNSTSLNELVRNNQKDHRRLAKQLNQYSNSRLQLDAADQNKKPKKLSIHTEKVVLKKFNKEFVQSLESIVQQSESPEQIDCYQFVMLLVSLGAIKQRDIENRHSLEYKKVEELWISLLKTSQHPLNGPLSKSQDKIWVKDAKLLLMAVFGLKGSKRLEVDDRGEMTKQRAQYYNERLPFGWLQSTGDNALRHELEEGQGADVGREDGKEHAQPAQKADLYLTPKCVKTLRQQFNLLYMNRINAIGQSIEDKKKQKLDKEMKQMTFMPSLLTDKMNDKILQIAQRKPSYVVINQGENSAPELAQRPSIMRARSVSKDYKRYHDTQANWRNQQLKLKEQKEMQDCTFKPNIKKSTKKYKNSQSTYFSTNLSSMAQLPTTSSASNIDTLQKQKTPQNVAGSIMERMKASIVGQTEGSTVSGDSRPLPSVFEQQKKHNQQNTNIQQKLKTMERFEQLYQVGKAHFQAKKILGNIPSDDRDYEKQKVECTFKPAKISKDPKKKPAQPESKESISPSKEAIQGIFQDYKQNELLNKMKAEEEHDKDQPVKPLDQKQKVKELLEKSQKQAIERQLQAQKDREYIKQCIQQGKPARLLQSQGKSPSAERNLTPHEAEIKIKSVTDRLSLVKKSQQAPPKKPQFANTGSLSQLPFRPSRPGQAVNDRNLASNQPLMLNPSGLPFRQSNYEPVLKNQRSPKHGSQDRSSSPGSLPEKPNGPPMMYVDVFIEAEGEPVKHRIPVYRGDQPNVLAEEFCIKHGYDLDTQDSLEQSLKQKIGEVVTKLDGSNAPGSNQQPIEEKINENTLSQDQVNRTQSDPNSTFDREVPSSTHERKQSELKSLDLEKIDEEEPGLVQEDMDLKNSDLKANGDPKR